MFGNFFKGIGDAVSGFFGGNRDDEERRRQQNLQQAASRQSAPQMLRPEAQQQWREQAAAQPNQVKTSLLPPQAQQPQLGGVEVKPRELNPLQDAYKKVADFTAQSNDAFLGGITRGATNVVNQVATGFNQDETQRRTDDFLRSIGQNQNKDGQSALAVGTDKNSTAGMIGQAVGGTQRLVAENAPFVAMPGVKAVEALKLPGQIGVNAAIGGVTGFGQGMASNQDLQGSLINAGVGGALGGVGTAVAPALGKLGSRFTGGENTAVTQAVDSVGRKEAITSANPNFQPKPLIPEQAAPLGPPQMATSQPLRVGTAPKEVSMPVEKPLQLESTPFDTPAPNPADEAVINQRLEDHPSQLPSGKTEKQKFTDKENMVSEITDTVISRAEAGDISGAKSAAYRLYEDPEYSAGTERGKAMYDRGQKLNEFIKKQEARQLQDTQKLAQDALAKQQAETPQLGSITRNAVLDGSINTEEGVANAIAQTRSVANAEAETAGDSLSNIIKKGQRVWEESKAKGGDLTPAQAAEHVPGFTPAQQAVYKNYSQEIGTLRDRSGLSIDGGQQGAWYNPRQALVEDAVGNKTSAEYNPNMVNEISRNKDQVTGGVSAADLDTSEIPIEQAIQRYADAPKASSQLMVNVAEEKGVKVPDEAKQKLEESFKTVIEKRDAALKMQDAGDIKGAKGAANEAQREIDKAFNKLADDIPKGTPNRQEAIQAVKEMRGTYMQSTMQTLSLSNVVNRLADQGTRAVYGAEQPLVKGISKAISPLFKGRAMEGTDAIALNTTKEAAKAAKQFAKGTLMNDVKSNFRSNMALAGAGRSLPVKLLAKADALPRALSSALTQMGDLSTQNVNKALQLGASRAEAAGLKTPQDYTKYFSKYVNTTKFADDLVKVQAMNNPRIGLAGAKGDNMVGGGRISNGLSNNVDNFVKNTGIKNGISENNRLLNEANDYVKGNLTGYAGVGSRVLRTVADAGALGIPKIRQAAKIAESGDPVAVAQATQVASQAIADAVALYGGAAAAAVALKKGGDVVGFTGAQPVSGSSESAYNKANNVPSNQWYLNVGGKRIYFDPARPLAGPGVAANLVGSFAKDGVSLGLPNSASQILNQAGGASIPDNIKNLQDAINPANNQGSKQYAIDRVGAMFAPSTGFLNNIANATDPFKREAKGFVDSLKSNLPGTRKSLPAAKDSQGNDIANSKQLTGGSYLASVTDNPDSAAAKAADPVKAEIDRLQKLDGSIFPTSSSKNAANPGVKDMSSVLLNNELYKNADDKGKAEMMKNVLSGNSSKDINQKLSSTDKSALLSGNLLGSDKKKVWLENNDNNLNYVTATVKNKEANGTLTSEDKDMRKTGSLAQQVAVAGVNKNLNVNQDTILGYKETNKTDFKKLADGSDEKEMLRAYDKALVEAGLPSKYGTTGLSSRGGGRSGGGGGGSKGSFAFASLPSSLIGTGGFSSGNGYDKAASLYTPIPSLKAPAAAAIPQGRTISVKKGR